MPCFTAFMRETARPSGVRGPVDSWALRRLAAIWAREGVLLIIWGRPGQGLSAIAASDVLVVVCAEGGGLHELDVHVIRDAIVAIDGIAGVEQDGERVTIVPYGPDR